MKKTISRFAFTLITLLTVSKNCSAQIEKGTNIFSVGLGLPGGFIVPGTYGGGETVFYSPSLDLNFEHGTINTIPHSLLSFGGYLSADIHTDDWSYDYGNGNNYYYHNHWTDFIVGAKGWYHLDFLNKNKYDVFASLMLGIRMSAYSYTTNDTYSNTNVYKSSQSSVGPAASISVGARYWFKPKMGVYGELGAGHDFAVIGLSFKL
jgi:hypothetical protein